MSDDGLSAAYGAGLKISAILVLVDADVDAASRRVRARGTKAWTRDRIARVADWAWPHVEEHLRTVLPGERVFRGVDRWQAGNYHRDRLRALGLTGYRLHDARHHWAVRMARAGARSSSSRGSSGIETWRWWRRCTGDSNGYG